MTSTYSIKRMRATGMAIVDEQNKIRMFPTWTLTDVQNVDAHDGVQVNSVIKFYDRYVDAVVGNFAEHDTDWKFGYVMSIDAANGSVRVRELPGTDRVRTSVYIHHLQPATHVEVTHKMFKVGDKVVVLDGAEIDNVVLGTAMGRTWSDTKRAVQGQVKEIRLILPDGDVVLENNAGFFSPQFLRKATPGETAVAPFKVGDSVICPEKPAAVPDGPVWVKEMNSYIGVVGKVVDLQDGHIHVKFPLHTFWWYHPSWLHSVHLADQKALESFDAALAACSLPAPTIKAHIETMLGKRKLNTQT